MSNCGCLRVVKMRDCVVDLYANRGCRCQSVAKLLIYQCLVTCHLPSLPFLREQIFAQARDLLSKLSMGRC